MLVSILILRYKSPHLIISKKTKALEERLMNIEGKNRVKDAEYVEQLNDSVRHGKLS